MNNSEGQTQEPVGGMKTKEEILEGYEYHRVMTDADYYEDLWPAGCIMQAMQEYHNQFTPPPAPINQERFNMPTDKQIVDMAIVFNDGGLDAEKLSDMVSMCQFVIDRLYENGDMLIPSSKENK